MAAVSDPGRGTSPLVLGPAAALAAVLVLLVAYPAAVVEASLGDFLLVTLFLGGAAAWMSGRAVAKSWGGLPQVFVYALLLTAAVRFCHFALFEGALFAPGPFAVEFVILCSISILGFRALRKQQMTQRYHWLYHAAGPLAWQPRAGGTADAS